MILLAIESSGAVASAAVWEDGCTRAEFSLNDGKTHSEKLLPLIGSALSALSLDIQAMDAVAVSVGPGSFTGLRIGVATANALAFANGIPVVETPTLAALAKGAAVENVLALIDAGSGRAYAAYYSDDALVWGPEALPISELAPRVPIGTAAVGDLAPASAQMLGLPFYRAMPRAGLVAETAAALFAAGRAVKEARPLYLLKPQAQRLLEERS